jgi:uncharacterized protein
MKFSAADTSGGHLITAYGQGRIQVGEASYLSSLIVTPERIVADWTPRSASQVGVADLARVLELDPEIIVLGTGARQVFPEPTVYTEVMARRVGIEIMDTGAACRTYNILMAEGRKVAAALVMI